MDEFKDMTLAELKALFATRKAAFDAFVASGNPTPARVEEATALRQGVMDVHAAVQKVEAGFGDLSFADESPTEEDKADESTESTEAEADKAPEGDKADDTNTVKGGTGSSEGGSNPVQESPGEGVPAGHTVGADGEPTPVQARSGVAQLAAQRGSTEATVPAHRRRGGRLEVRAAAEATIFTAGQKLDSYHDVAEAVVDRVKSFPEPAAAHRAFLAGGGVEGQPQLTKFGTAMLTVPMDNGIVVDGDKASHDEIEEAIKLATDETTLPGGSLVAAGGWCAPSEIDYTLDQDATLDGMLSLPEIGVRRGGLKWPVSPNFAAFYANPGFIQTETQAIAGTTKPCVEVDCPTFDEARLDVEGLCIKVPILTNVGYPEYVKNFIDGTMVAHQHWINANKIQRLVTMAGAAKVVTELELGSTAADTLSALAIMGERTRQKYRLGFKASLEVVLPHWVSEVIRGDLANRTGQPFQAVTDEQINGFFRARKLNVQWVYDWQDLPLADDAGTAGTDESIALPSTFQALMYPAGTVFVGTQPVINLSTVYDSAELQVNRFTGLFTEQAFLVGKRKFHVDLLTMSVCMAGRTGAADITCAA